MKNKKYWKKIVRVIKINIKNKFLIYFIYGNILVIDKKKFYFERQSLKHLNRITWIQTTKIGVAFIIAFYVRTSTNDYLLCSCTFDETALELKTLILQFKCNFVNMNFR